MCNGIFNNEHEFTTPNCLKLICWFYLSVIS